MPRENPEEATVTAPGPTAATATPAHLVNRLRAALLGAWAAVTGTAPHVLHHVGPLAGSALVAGAGGRLLFGALGFAATIPTLRRLRRRTGSWRAPGLALAAFATIYAVSALLIGPAISDATQPPAAPAESVDPHGHDG